MPLRRGIALPAAVLSLLGSALCGTASAKPGFTATPGGANPDARFVVRYEGSGSYKTRFHATPPNPGGKPDTNDAWDSSAQAWKIKFRKALSVPTCAQPASFGDDPCADVAGL